MSIQLPALASKGDGAHVLPEARAHNPRPLTDAPCIRRPKKKSGFQAAHLHRSSGLSPGGPQA